MNKTEGWTYSVLSICVAVVLCFALVASMRSCEAHAHKDEVIESAAANRGSTILPGGQIIGK